MIKLLPQYHLIFGLSSLRPIFCNDEHIFWYPKNFIVLARIDELGFGYEVNDFSVCAVCI